MTHILKPPNAELDGHAENEHFCLKLARRLGMPTAATQVMHFEDEVAIVVERYDRCRTTEELVRVHQEDICQALGVYPFRKYQNEGGTGARSVIELLRAHSSSSEADIPNFLEPLPFHWLTARPQT